MKQPTSVPAEICNQVIMYYDAGHDQDEKGATSKEEAGAGVDGTKEMQVQEKKGKKVTGEQRS